MNPAEDQRRRFSGATGEMLTRLCGGTIGLCLLMVFLLLAVLAYNGLGHFWQKEVVLLTLTDGSKVLGEIHGREPVPASAESPEGENAFRIKVKTGNRDLTGIDFRWIDEDEIIDSQVPPEVLVLERMEWGNFYGTMQGLKLGNETFSDDPDGMKDLLYSLQEKKSELLERIKALETGAIGDVNYRIEELTLARKELDLRDMDDDRRRQLQQEIDSDIAAREHVYRQLANQLGLMREELLRESALMSAADGTTQEIQIGNIVNILQPNSMGMTSSTLLYAKRVWAFLSDEPREANTEGGIFPAIFGTVMMVFLMVMVAAPLGVLAAVYMREYAKQGWIIRVIRIAVNNLAGVPSIVFGVFGLGFFVYLVGGSIDRMFYPEALPTPTFGTGGIIWASLTLALLTVPVVIVAAEEGIAAVPRIVREGSLALGATRFETTWKVVVPAAAPGILTGVILAMARAAGEVAPLMIVGVVKLAPALAVDQHAPYLHLERKFMHLGFHIYDLAFQSPNVESTKPLVFATALLLVVIVVIMNLVATSLRNHLRKKYASSSI